MVSPLMRIFWLVIVTGALVAITGHFTLEPNSGSIYLTEPFVGQTARWTEILRESIAGFSVKVAFHSVLVLIGLLLIWRAAVSAIIVIRQKRYAELLPTGQAHHDEPASLVGEGWSRGMPSRSRGHWRVFPRGFTGKMLLAFTGAVALFGFGTVAVVYLALVSSLREHHWERATVLAVNVSDAAASYMVAKRSADLRSLLRKSALRAAAAYLIVEDRQMAIAAHSFAVLPVDLQQPHSWEPNPQQLHRRSLTVGASEVYEIVVPVLEGQAGVVRLGFWADEVEAEIGRTVLPIVFWLLAVVAAGIVCSVYLVWRINRPIVKLVRIASSISKGDLDMPLSGTRDPGEFGELARAVESIRSSIKAAMARFS